MGIFEELKRRNVIRVAVAYLIVSWLVAQIADLVLDNIGAPDWVMPTLFLMLALGFVAALIISWAYEITPEGIKREQDVIRDDSITHLTAKKLDYITIAAALAVAVMFGLQLSDNNRSSVSDSGMDSDAGIKVTAPGDRSIAVLPFANRSNNEDDLFFTDGIHDDLLTQLAKITDLRVTSRTSVMPYRETDKQIPEIARELGVSTILEGGVQRAGQRIRINAQLIDVATDEHLWAETFDREMSIDNLFDIQSEITRHIVAAVRGELTDDEQQALAAVPTNSLEAYEAYSRARALLYDAGYNVKKYARALPFAEQAIETDPEFALAHLLLANLHAQLYWAGIDASAERREAAYAAEDKAAALLPQDSPELLALQGEFLYRFDEDYSAALEIFRRADAAMPGNARVASQLAYALRRLGRWEEAIDVLLQVIESDPANISAAYDVVDNLIYTGQWSRLQVFMSQRDERLDDSVAIMTANAGVPLWTHGDVIATRKRLDQVPPNGEERYFTLTTELPWYERDFAAAVAAWDRPEIMELTSLAGYTGLRELYLARAYRELGDQDRAAEMLQQGLEQFAEPNFDGPRTTIAYDAVTFAELLAFQGEFERAIATAEKAYNLVSPDSDHVGGLWTAMGLTRVLALSGERDRALELLAKFIDKPAATTRWEFYLDPRWDFFRDDERFNELIRPHNLDDRQGSTE
jgi:TolB-like protein/tetratricopeptide (TPR) repeat protein